MKVIFLDIDGVLVNLAALKAGRAEDGDCRFDPVCVARLNRITDATGAVLVVSSTWRRLHDDMARVLSRNSVSGRMIGQTPDLSRQRPSGIQVAVQRGDEIQAWLDDNQGVETFIILDDDDDMGTLRRRLVRTLTIPGLSEVEVRRAIQLLKE